MGTRADFYIGTGPDMQYIGSINGDGYPLNEHNNGIPKSVLVAKDPETYIKAIKRYADNKLRNPWPWPWPDSTLTDYAYTFACGEVLVSHWGHVYLPARSLLTMTDEEMSEAFNSDTPKLTWPQFKRGNPYAYGITYRDTKNNET